MDIKADQWVWVVVHGPEGNERLLGQHDTETDISFVPCYLEKEAAQAGVNLLVKNPVQVYTPQAMIYEDLEAYSRSNGFMIYVLKASGEIIEKISA